MEHVWFKDFDWKGLLDKKIQAPFIPPKEDNFDAAYTNADWKDANDENMKQNTAILRRNSVQALFNGYYHDDVIGS